MSAVLESLRRNWDGRAATLPGDASLRKCRQSALEDFLARGLPTTREEDWKYTSLAALADRELAPPEAVSPETALEAVRRHEVQGMDAVRLTFVNGLLVPAASDLQDAGALQIVPLSQALGQGLGSECLDRVIDLDRYRFARLNTALFTDGAYVRIPRGVTIAQPVYLLFITLGAQTPPLVQPRILIDAGQDSTVTVIEHFCGEAHEALINTVTELLAGAGSTVHHYRIQEQNPAHTHIAGLNARLERDAQVECHNVDLGGALVRNDVHVRLAATGARIDLNGLYFTTGNAHVDNHTRIDHLAPHTVSSEDYRGVLDGRSRAVFNGRVIVAEDAQKIEARQSNSNLLLCGDCEVDTKPELEIYADDVKCSHGATVGQLDETALFYLRSRGLDSQTARGLLTFAFAEEIIGRLRVPALRERLSHTVIGRLPDSDKLKEFT